MIPRHDRRDLHHLRVKIILSCNHKNFSFFESTTHPVHAKGATISTLVVYWGAMKQTHVVSLSAVFGGK